MEKGELFKLAGYDVVGSAQCDFGDVLVLNNNSNVYIVATNETGGSDLDASGRHVVQRHPVARVEAIHHYGDSVNSQTGNRAYQAALADMVAVALNNIQEDDEERCDNCGEAVVGVALRPSGSKECETCWREGLAYAHRSGLHESFVVDCPYCKR